MVNGMSKADDVAEECCRVKGDEVAFSLGEKQNLADDVADECCRVKSDEVTFSLGERHNLADDVAEICCRVKSDEIAFLVEGAERLAEKFRNSQLLKDYSRHKKSLELDPELYERVLAYQKNRFEHEYKRENGNVNFDEEKRLAYYYTELSLHPVAGPFLASESEFLQLYRKAMDIIFEACDV